MKNTEISVGQRSDAPPTSAPRSLEAVMTLVGGALMGAANIIPGVSGGTMLLAIGIYEKFVTAVADVTRLKFRTSEIIFLVMLSGSAIVAIFALADLINWGLTNHQHIMFALFIGLTLGGVPLLWRMIHPIDAVNVIAGVVGIGVMLTTTFALSALEVPTNFVFMFIGGIIGSTAMVLPGISGSYLLLMLGLYAPITAGISSFKDAALAFDLGAAMAPGMGVILPVGLGVLAGVAGLSNLLNVLLKRWHNPTIGALMGLLLGSVVFLYPFRAPGPRDPFEFAAEMTGGNLALVIVCVVLGFVATAQLSRLEQKAEGK